MGCVGALINSEFGDSIQKILESMEKRTILIRNKRRDFCVKVVKWSVRRSK